MLSAPVRCRTTFHGDVLISRRFDARATPAGYERLGSFNVRLDVPRWFEDPKTRRELLALLDAARSEWRDAAVDTREAMGMCGRFVQALERGELVAYRRRPRRIVMPVDSAAPPSLGPADDAAPGEELIEVMLFDWAGQPLSSSLYPATVRFTARLGDGQNLPGGLPAQEWRIVSRGSGVVKDISGDPPSACKLSFFDDFSDVVPAEVPGGEDTAPPDAATLGRALRPVSGPTLVTRRGLVASPQAATLEMTNVFQLQRHEADVLELEHFNEGSAVFLPGLAPAAIYREGVMKPPQGVDALKACLTFARGYSVDQIVITGHDASVSQERADCVKALLVGDDVSRSAWTKIAMATAVDGDIRAILKWTAETFGWGSDPDVPRGRAIASAIQEFKIAYNRDVRGGLFSAVRPGLPLLEDGLLDAATWEAIFDCYMRAIRPVAGAAAAPLPSWAKYPEGDATTRTGANAARPQGKHPFVVLGPNGPGNAPITIAQYGGGDQNLAFTALQEVNPQYRVGTDREFVGQALNVPDGWADRLATAPLGGYTVQRDPLPGPPPPAEPGPPPLADAVQAFGCGAHHLRTPFANAANRRGVQRHAEVVFFDRGSTLGVCQCGPGDGPCRALNCEVYDPREVVLRYDTRGSVRKRAVFRVRAHDTGAPLANARVAVRSTRGTLLELVTDVDGKASVEGVEGEIFHLVRIFASAGDDHVVRTELS